MASVPVVQPRVSLVPVRSAPPIPSSLKMTTLKDPERLEPADDCPVIVWGDYRYWPFSYVDNRYAMCLVAYDSSNNVVSRWELTGARYVVRVSVNDSRQEITLLGQSSQTVTVSWSQIGMVVPINPQYFWIINVASQTALYDSGTAQRYLLLGPRAVNDAQLWLVDSGRQAIFPKSSKPGSMCLDYVEVPAGRIYLDQTNWGKKQQRWIINAKGILKPAATTSLVATTDNSNNAVVMDLSSTPSYQWYLKPYIPSPDLSTDQFPLLIPGESFTLSNQDQMLSSSGSGPLTLVPDTSNSARWLYHGDGVLVNAQNGLALTASSSSVIASPLTGHPEQQWSLTTNGYFVCRANGLLMVGRGKTVLLSSYNALGSADHAQGTSA